MAFILFGCQSGTNHAEFDTTTKLVTCQNSIDNGGYLEDRFWVVNGYLVRREIRISTPHEYYLKQGYTIEEVMKFKTSVSLDTISFTPPFENYPPYNDGENIIETVMVETYDDLSLFDDEIRAYRLDKHLTKDKDKIVFDSLFNELQEAWKTDDSHYTCEIHKYNSPDEE
ncbi:MAG: hypothetical protein PUF50_02720 [Erysipelotrichaceae bacterium]|nr:hypothetical protein [Erysipelotrichaceae bacterium]